MPTTVGDAVDGCELVMSGLDAFDSAVELTRVQLRDLLNRAGTMKHPGAGWALPVGAQDPHPVDREVIALQHPVHVLADLITMSERAGLPLERIAFCCTGDGASALTPSLMLAGTALGMDVRIAAPAKYAPAEGAVARAHHLAAASRAGLLITTNSARAAEGAHFVINVPYGRHVSSAITETSALATRPPAPRPLTEEQDVNRLWVLEAVLADWLYGARSTWSNSAGG